MLIPGSWLCGCGYHRFRDDPKGKVTPYVRFDDNVSSTRPYSRSQVCTRCGAYRVWSLSRGKWKRLQVDRQLQLRRYWEFQSEDPGPVQSRPNFEPEMQADEPAAEAGPGWSFAGMMSAMLCRLGYHHWRVVEGRGRTHCCNRCGRVRAWSPGMGKWVILRDADGIHEMGQR